jgi:hypothetical protein
MLAFQHPRRDRLTRSTRRAPYRASLRAFFRVKTRRAAVAGLDEGSGEPALAAHATRRMDMAARWLESERPATHAGAIRRFNPHASEHLRFVTEHPQKAYRARSFANLL